MPRMPEKIQRILLEALHPDRTKIKGLGVPRGHKRGIRRHRKPSR